MRGSGVRTGRMNIRKALRLTPQDPQQVRRVSCAAADFFHREPDCRSASRFTEDPNSPTKFTGGFRVAFTAP